METVNGVGAFKQRQWWEVEPESFLEAARLSGSNLSTAKSGLARADNFAQVNYINPGYYTVFQAGGANIEIGERHFKFKARLVEKVPGFLTVRDGSGGQGVSTTGWDPEIFVTDAKNELLPAFRFLPSKAEPLPWTATEGVYGSNYKDSSIYYDGFQAEFTTASGSCHGYGMDSIRQGLKGVLTSAKKYDPTAKLSLKSVFRVSPRVMDTCEDEHIALGCSPSSNVYGKDALFVENARLFPYRVAGGHVHFGLSSSGWGQSKDWDIPAIVKALDLFCALPCVGLFADIDDPLRREFYGRAGEYRTPSYGIEYRTLSNAWLCSPVIAHGVMNLARKAVNIAKWLTPKEFGLSDEDLQGIINYCDVKSARKVVEANWKWFSSALATVWPTPDPCLRALKTGLLEGVGSIFPEYENVENNWRIGSHQTWENHSNGSRLTWGSTFKQ